MDQLLSLLFIRKLPKFFISPQNAVKLVREIYKPVDDIEKSYTKKDCPFPII